MRAAVPEAAEGAVLLPNGGIQPLELRELLTALASGAKLRPLSAGRAGGAVSHGPGAQLLGATAGGATALLEAPGIQGEGPCAPGPLQVECRDGGCDGTQTRQGCHVLLLIRGFIGTLGTEDR